MSSIAFSYSRSSVSGFTTAASTATLRGGPLYHELGGVDEEARARRGLEPRVHEGAHLPHRPYEPLGGGAVEPALRNHYLGLHLLGGVVELEGDEPLASARLQVLKDVLVARVVGDDEHEVLGCVEHLPCLLHGEYPPVVGKGVYDYRRVLSRLP